MIEGALIALGSAALGWFGGWLSGRRERSLRRPAVKPATCACEHARSMHIDGRGVCHALVRRSSYKTGKVTEYNEICGCQIYDGPEPLPQPYYVPEIDTSKEANP